MSPNPPDGGQDPEGGREWGEEAARWQNSSEKSHVSAGRSRLSRPPGPLLRVELNVWSGHSARGLSVPSKCRGS